MASFMGQVDTSSASSCRGPRRSPTIPQLPEHNFIDAHVYRQAEEAATSCRPSCATTPSSCAASISTSSARCRRPTRPARFLADKRPDRRARLVDELLERPEYADYWALKWADLLRVDRQALGHKRAYAYYRWIRDSLATNKPLDQFARELLTAEGPLDEVAAGQLLQGRDQAGRGGQHAVAGLPRRAHRLRRVPPSSVRPLEPDRLLRHAGVLHAGRRARRRRAARRCSASGDPATKHPRTGETILAHALGSRCRPTIAAGRPPPSCWPTG